MGQIKVYDRSSLAPWILFNPLLVLLVGILFKHGLIMSTWFWSLALIHITGLGYGLVCYIQKWLPVDTEWDTSEITQDDINRFLCNKKLYDEIRSEKVETATKWLNHFIHRSHLWEFSTQYHLGYKGIQIHFGHKQIEIKNDWKSKGYKLNKTIMIHEEKGKAKELKPLVKTAREKFEQIKSVRNI